MRTVGVRWRICDALLGLLVFRNWSHRGRLPKVTAAAGLILSVIYAAYKTRMYIRMQTVIAAIRVDLLLIVPLLWVLTALVVGMCFKRASRV